MGSIKESKKEKSSKENVAPAEECVTSKGSTAAPATKETPPTDKNSSEPAKDLASTSKAPEKEKEIPRKGSDESEEDSYIKAKKSDEIFEPVVGKEMDLAPPYMYVNVKSCMAGLEETRIRVMFLHETVYELKQKIYLQNKVPPEKQVLIFDNQELTENNKKLTDCGVIPESIILMNVRMISGQTQKRVVEVKKKTETPKCSEEDLKKKEEVRRSLEERKRKMRKETEEEKKTNETVARDVETTREKMKQIAGKEKAKRILSTSSISLLKPSSSSTISKKTISTKSNPLEYLRTLRSKGNQKKKNKGNKLLKQPVTEEELKHFFETSETLEELKKNREKEFMVPPPENVEELELLKKHFQELRKTRCGECKEKLAEEEQSVHCNCGKRLCAGHRKKHNCDGHRTQKSKKMRKKKKKKTVC